MTGRPLAEILTGPYKGHEQHTESEARRHAPRLTPVKVRFRALLIITMPMNMPVPAMRMVRRMAGNRMAQTRSGKAA